LSKKLVTLTVQGGVPREGYEVCTPQGQKVGRVVSGMFCPTLQIFAANAFVSPAFSKVGTELIVLIHEKAKPAVVSQRPLYIPVYRRDS
jgi:glycine cleavage system aminomethyltransferase T